MADFSGKIAIVTGGTKGIGAACAKQLYERGVNVVIVARNIGASETLAAEIKSDTDGKGGASKGSLVAVQADVSVVSDIEYLVGVVSKHFGKLDILVNNAGMMQTASIEDTTEEEWDQVVATNMKSVFFMTQKALPLLKKAGGMIVNVASLSGRNGGLAEGLAYTASKAGIIGLTKGFASRLAADGICVNAVAPGTIEPGKLEGISEEKMADLKKKIPLGRIGKPEEIAAAVVFLCSGEAKYITGAVLDMNGGMYIA